MFGACKDKTPNVTAQDIVDKTIFNACQGNCEHATIDFVFRDRKYISKRNNGSYSLERLTQDSTGLIHDIVTNEGFVRYKDDSLVKVPDSMVTRYSNSVNSVHYFAQLPFGLNAPAVNKELLGDAIIKGEPYYEIGVSFNENGGGTDFEDEFVYWIHKDRFTVDYLAYSYATDGGGIRFREAYNERLVNGIRFVDYNNYKPKSLKIQLTQLDSLFQANELKLLSKIETEEVRVQLQKG
ncbi:MAG: hypothetical protein Aureis2KO_30240 [Aureisphaera sp.]